MEIALHAVGWLFTVAAVGWLTAALLVRLFRDEAPPVDISAPPKAAEQTCPECGRTILATDEVHFDGRRYRHSWCSFNRTA